MKKLILVILTITAITFIATECSKPIVNSIKNELHNVTNCYCIDTLKCDELCATMPLSFTFLPQKDIELGYSGGLDTIHQPPFDQFGWQTFVALNWPADDNGNPIADKAIGTLPDNKRVWEHFIDIDQLFGDTKGCEYCKTDCENVVMKMSKSSIEEFDDNVLIDKNLNFVVYDINVNPTEEAYIKKLQNDYDTFTKSTTINIPKGAIEVKSSWRILEDKKDSAAIANKSYYTRKATIYVPTENSASGKALCISTTLGLVGFHIAFKNNAQSRFDPWLWVSFEHIDNAPTLEHTVTNAFSFYNSECEKCPINQALGNSSKEYKWADKPPYAKAYAHKELNGTADTLFGTQVIRAGEIFTSTQKMNKEWQEKLKNTPFANYQLLGTQWGIKPDGALPHPTHFFPAIMANTTLETYFQASSSCGSCHSFASLKLKDGSRIKADHSFLLNRLSKRPKAEIKLRKGK